MILIWLPDLQQVPFVFHHRLVGYRKAQQVSDHPFVAGSGDYISRFLRQAVSAVKNYFTQFSEFIVPELGFLIFQLSKGGRQGKK